MQNAQLWKRILNEGLVIDIGHPTDKGRDRVNDKLGERLPNEIIKSPIIVDRTTGSLDGTIDWTIYRNLAFPFPQFWIEGTVDDKLWGGLVIADATMFHAFCFGTVSGSPVGCVGVAQVALDGTRSLVIKPDGEVVMTGDSSFAIESAYGLKNSHNSLRTTLSFICDTLRLLSCKNVGLKPNPIDKPEAWRAAKRTRFGTPDSYRYHTLVVRPAGASRSSTAGEEIGTMPRHVCRGHNQHYGPAAEHGHPDGRDRGLLFGKYAGCFYMPPHLKGDKKNGVVEKDYQIGGGSIEHMPPHPGQ